MTDFEKIAKIMEKTGASEADARAALDANGGEILDAVIWLERAKKVEETKTAYYSTGDAPSEEQAANEVLKGDVIGEEESRRRAEREARRREREERRSRNGEEIRSEIRRFWDWVCAILEASVKTNFCADRHGEELIGIPVLIAVLIFLAATPISICVILFGLFMGCHYHLRRTDRGNSGRDQN